MDDISFWLRCVKARCLVAPVPTYSQYGEDGNIHQDHFVGILYAALPFDEQAVGPDYYIYIEEGQADYSRLYSTPEAALAAAERARPNVRANLDPTA